MNQIIVNHKKVNNGKETTLYTSMPKDETETQLAEIFADEHYKTGKIRKDMTVIDCGANIGLASLYFKDWAKIIYALEPSSQHYAALVKNVEGYENIKTFNVGLANIDGYDSLSSDGGGGVPVSFFGKEEPREMVRIKTIDNFMDENEIEHVDLLKIDTEGAEYVILPSAGFKKIAHKIDYIIGESHYVGDRLIPDFIPLILEDVGFEARFLPIGNMSVYMSLDTGVEKKQYKVSKKTMFFAKRKGLK